MWPLLVFALLSDESSCICSDSSSLDTLGAITGNVRVAQSPNFDVDSHPGCCDARQLARSCEAWRTHLRGKWLGQVEGQWTPRCMVVLHAQRSSYVAAVGRGAERSFGSSWIGTEANCISRRRIDLLVNARGEITALGHELTHVVLADAFGAKPPPPWANEGIALLADAAQKRTRHAEDAARAKNSGTAFRCLELMTLDHYPRPERIPAFYGQSALLAEFLCQRGEPQQLVAFIKQSEELGYDRALARNYGIAGVGELERLWAQSSSKQLAGGAAPPPSTFRGAALGR